MAPYCFVLIAGLCFSGHNVKADVRQMGMMSAVEVTGTDAPPDCTDDFKACAGP